MSMNLHCEQMDLCQTPTWVTYACYLADVKSKTPSDWKTIREKYIAWYSSGFGKKPSRMDRECRDAHINQLRSFEKLDFYVM
jgi:hypothetical protein